MPKVLNKRITSSNEDNIVVFLIGMRINKFWKFKQWGLFMRAMPKMLKELYQNPELGFLSHEMWFGRSTILVQYWRSIEQLNAYAKNRNAEHLPAWQAFNKKIASNGNVGIWHESYIVKSGNYETIYNNMPLFGLAKAKQALEINSLNETAEQRLNNKT